MNFPKISIVTPSYNQGQFLEETICSILNQGYPNLEYIIIDGGSTDESVEIIRKYEKHLKYWVSEKDAGQTDAILKGLSHCTGEIFNWINSDDLLYEDSLFTIADKFRADNVDIVSGTEIHFDGNAEWNRKGTLIYPCYEENLFHGVIYQPSTFWRMEVFKRFNLNRDLHYMMDSDIWLHYLAATGTNRVVKINKPLAKFRLHEDSKTVSLQKNFRKERWQLRQKLLEDLQIQSAAVMKYIKGLDLGINFVRSFAFHKNPDHEILQKLYLEEIAYHFYVEFQYVDLEQLLHEAWRKKIYSNRLALYWLKINLLPRRILNAFRRK